MPFIVAASEAANLRSPPLLATPSRMSHTQSDVCARHAHCVPRRSKHRRALTTTRRQEAADQYFESNGSLCDSSSGQMAHGERRACEPAVSHGHRPQQLAAFRRSWRGLAAISCDLLRILYGTSTIVASTAVQVSKRVHIERYYVRFVKVTLLTPPPRGPRQSSS